MKMEQTDCSKTSAYKIQTPWNYPEETMLTLLVKQFRTVPTDSPGESYNSIANGRTYLITAASSVEFSHISWCFLTSLHSQLTLITNICRQSNFKHELTNGSSARE